ncbi:hypothetical protein OIU76_004334 [Salix suchowensis]|nr:hypothetical protein OIU76_004334 [Salix suchowensis]
MSFPIVIIILSPKRTQHNHQTNPPPPPPPPPLLILCPQINLYGLHCKRETSYHLGLHDPTHNNSDSNSNSNFDDNGWGYCTEEQLEETLLKNLDFLYKEAISKLVGLGYDEDVALKAILRNGHCYGGMDVLTNILHNSLAFLNNNNNDDGSGGGDNGNADETELVFDDLRQLEEYSLSGLVCFVATSQATFE